MTSFSVLGIGLSFAFGCMLLGLVAELYYLLWWKNRISSRITEDSSQSDVVKEPSHLFCVRSLRSRCIENSSSSNNSSSDEMNDHNSSTGAIVEHETDLELGIRGVVKMGNVEEGAECEIMRMYNMCGPPRFLFTIKEETKDELVEVESIDDDDDDDRKSRTRSMSDAPFLSPLGSPVMKSHNHYHQYHHGYNLNPLFEHFTEVEEEVMNRVRCSPPPKFKFLRDAEEKLVRKLMEEAQIKKSSSAAAAAAAAGKW